MRRIPSDAARLTGPFIRFTARLCPGLPDSQHKVIRRDLGGGGGELQPRRGGSGVNSGTTVHLGMDMQAVADAGTRASALDVVMGYTSGFDCRYFEGIEETIESKTCTM